MNPLGPSVRWLLFVGVALTGCVDKRGADDSAEGGPPSVCEVVHGGETRWGPPVQVTDNGLEATVSVDEAGNVYVAYMKETDAGAGIASALSVSKDCGQTFTEVFETQVLGGFSGDVTTAVGPDGAAYMAWIDYSYSNEFHSSVQLISSVDRGESWSEPSTVAAGVIDGVSMYHDRPWLVVADDGTTDGTIDLSVAEGPTADGEPETVLFRSTDAGASWSPAVSAAPDYEGGYGFSAFGVVDVGEPVLTYVWYDEDRTEERYGTLTLERGSAAFTMREFGVIDDYTTKAFPTYVSQPGGGHACFTYLAPKAQRSEVYSQSSADGGATFSDPVLVDDSGALSNQWMPTSTIDAQGRCHLFWLDSRSGSYQPWSAIVEADGSVTDAGAVSDAAFDSDADHSQSLGDYLVITTTSDSRFAVWTDNSGGAERVYLSSAAL